MSPVISVEDLSKVYRLGQIGGRTLSEDLNRWWAKMRGKPNPYLKIGQEDRSNLQGEYIWALKDVSFTVDQGEVVGIIGRNGAGKSTLLKIMSRVTAPTSGQVRVKGRIASLLEVGTGFHPELTGRENIYLNGAILGMSRTEVDHKFDEIMAFAELEQFIDTPVKRYSSGMYVRLAFAVAAHLEPEILMVDEVLAVGDAAFQKKCLGRMKDVARGGKTVLFVSHNMGMIRSLCSRGILLLSGNIAMDSKADDVVSHYLTHTLDDQNPGGQVHWEVENAPGVEDLKLLSIRLLGVDGQPKGLFDVNHPINIEITYRALKLIRGMRISLVVNTEDNVIAFASSNEHYQSPHVEPGVYRAICTIPPHLLNEKQYTINVVADIPNVRMLLPHGEQYLAFGVSGGGHIGSAAPSTWPGVIAPKLNWVTMKVA